MTPGFGLGILRRDVGSDTLVARGVGDHDSAYTEDGPGPGHPVPVESGSRWRPVLQTAQTVAITLATYKGGYPGRDGAAVLYRLDTDTDPEDFRSWNEPNLVAGWSAPADGWGASQAYDRIAACVIDETQRVIVTALNSLTGAAVTWSWDPRTDTWATLYDWAAGALDGLQAPIGMAYDRERARVLLWSGSLDVLGFGETAYESTDGGTTWTRYSSGFGGPGGAEQSFVVAGDDLDWLTIGNAVPGSATTAIRQLASSDQGVSWDEIGTITGTGSGSLPQGQPALGPSGFVYVTIDDATHDLVCYLASTARGAFTSIATIDSARDYSACWACVDADGTIYAFGRGTSTHIDELEAFYSTDGGFTWVAYDVQVWNQTSTTDRFEPRAAVASAGRVHLIGTAVGSSSTDGTVQIVSLGGYSQVGQGVGVDGVHTRKARFGWGATKVNHADHEALVYLPVSAPGNLGWTAVTSTGTASLAAATPGLALTTTAGQGQLYRKLATGSRDFAPCVFDVQLDASGNVTLATLGTAGGGVTVTLSLQKAGGSGWMYPATVDIGTDGIQLRDGSTVRATVSLSMTSQPTRIKLQARKGAVTAWYSRDVGVTWTRWADDVVITNLGAGVALGGDMLFWGNDTTRVGKSYWRLVAFATGEDWLYGIDGIVAAGNTSADGVRGHQFGRPVPGRGWAYPLPEAGDVGGTVPRLTATGGPTHAAEFVALPVAYVHGIEHIDPMVSPSPRRTWQATGDDAVQLTWDLGANQQTWHGGAVALLVIGAPRTWLLERSDGGGGFETLGTLDLAVGSGLTWTRTGRTITPRSGTATIARRISAGELVGGYVDLDGTARKITRNSAGFWTSTAGVQQVRIELDGVDGTEGANGTAGVLVAPGGVLVAYPSTDIARRYLRLTATANQVVPAGVYTAGAIAVARVVGFDDPDWTWSSSRVVSRTYAVAADGVSTATELGPSRRVMSYGWEAAALGQVRTLAAAPAVIEASGGVPIGTLYNPIDLGALVDEMESGAIPVLVLPRLPAATSTITDPSLWMLARVSSSAITTTGQVGTEGLDELVGVSGFAAEELK